MVSVTTRRRVSAILLPMILVLTGGALVARAASAPPTTATALAPQRPVIVIHSDPGAVHAASASSASGSSAAAAAPQATAPDAVGQPRSLPVYVPPPQGGDTCESVTLPHPSGFTSMGGTGSDTITQPDGSSSTYIAYTRHASLQLVCLRATGDGGVETQAVLEATGADDPSTYDFLMSPSGVTLVSLDPGRAETPSDFLATNQRLASWPTNGCGRVVRSDLGPRHASIDDTFCFSPNGAIRHVDLHERATGSDGVSRNLQVSFDLFPNG